MISVTAADKSSKVATSHLSRVSALRYFHGVFLPSVTYTFPVNLLRESDLLKIQGQAYPKFLPKLGYNRNTPRAIVCGPKSLGGLQLRPLYDEQGAGQVEQFLKHYRSDTGVATHLQIMLAWAQKLSGIGIPLLSAPQIHLPHIESHLPLISTLRTYLARTNSKIDLDRDYAVPHQRDGDKYLMELVLFSQTIWFDS